MRLEEQQVRQAHAAWIGAVNAGDPGRLLALMADDAVFLSPGAAPMDRDAFGPNFSDAHRRFRLECRSDLEEVVVVGDVAYTRSRDALSLTRKGDGETTRLAGHRMTVYRRQPDGRWLVARDAHTLSPE